MSLPTRLYVAVIILDYPKLPICVHTTQMPDSYEKQRGKFLNDIVREKPCLLNPVQEFIEIEAWLFPTFFIFLQN